jgi:hypothetical protein
MTYRQIGAEPHKACCHTEDRPGCLHCANHLRVIERDSQVGQTVKTSEGER